MADLFVEGVDGVAFKAPQARGEGLFLAAVPSDKVDLAGRQVMLTVSAPPEMAEIPAQAERQARQERLFPRCHYASWRLPFLGGLILNLMLCVLPVLALKLSGGACRCRRAAQCLAPALSGRRGRYRNELPSSCRGAGGARPCRRNGRLGQSSSRTRSSSV